jgi:hypothetical protein
MAAVAMTAKQLAAQQAEGFREPVARQRSRWSTALLSPAATIAGGSDSIERIALSLALANFQRAHRLRGTWNIGSFSTMS